MSTFLLIPGAGGMAAYWQHVVPLLRASGHEAIAVELPADDPQAGLAEYATIAIAALGERTMPVVVAQSLGGFTAPLVCERIAARMLVFVNAMIPRPREVVGDWGAATGSSQARLERAQRHGYTEALDLDVYFFHDTPRIPAERDQSERIWTHVCEFERWPDIPIHVIAGRDDRLFPIEFQRRVARDRLGVDVDEIAGGHLVALANPRGLVDQLLAYLA